jgi:hypothetical protein
MKGDGFEQELIRGIKKLIPQPVFELERKKKQKKIHSAWLYFSLIFTGV